MKAGTQVRLKENAAQTMTIRAVIGENAVCDYLYDGKLCEWTGAITDLEEMEQEEDLFPAKIAPTLAATELKKWLDFKRIKPGKRNAFVDHINVLLQAIVYGDIEITKDFKIIHNLNVPLLDTDQRPVYAKLEYAPRVTAQALNEALGKAGNDSEIANTIAYGSALADLPVEVIRKLDSSDLSIIMALSVFFA